MEDIKITLEAARVNAKLTQREAAEALGVSFQTICSWEKEPSKIPIGKAIALCDIYGFALNNVIFVP